MKSKTKLFGIYLPIFILALILGVLFRSLACLNDFNSQSYHFDSPTFITVANVTVLIGALFLLTFLFKKNREMRFIPNFTSIPTYVSTGLVTASQIFLVTYLFPLAKYEYTLFNEEYRTYPLRSAGIIHFLIAIFAILSIIHFVMTVLIEKHSSTPRAIFGLGTVIFLALYSVHLYFDTSMPVNAPSKLIDELAFLFSALFFLYETRLSMGREKWRAYIATGFIAALLTAYSSIPSLITFFVNKETVSNNIYESTLAFSLFVFITARILLTSKLVEDKKNPHVEALSAFASAREKVIFENDLRYAPLESDADTQTEVPTEEESENAQITIDELMSDPEKPENEFAAENTEPQEDEERASPSEDEKSEEATSPQSLFSEEKSEDLERYSNGEEND